MSSLSIKIDGQHVSAALQQGLEMFNGHHDEVVLDFSSVRRIDPAALRTMESFVEKVNGNGTKVELRGVNVDVYKVLKLMKLAPRFCFRS